MSAQPWALGPNDVTLTVRQAARILKRHPNTIYRAIKDRQIPCTRIRGTITIPARWVMTVASEGTEGPAPAMMLPPNVTPIRAARGRRRHV